MKEIAVGNRYALAIYDIAKDLNRLEEMYKELKVVMETYELNNDFKNFINHPLVKKEDKKEFVSKLFSKEFSEETINLLHYLIDKTRLSQIKSIVTEYLKIYYEII
jgi:F-type H+-transporting ATPase subunit delta